MSSSEAKDLPKGQATPRTLREVAETLLQRGAAALITAARDAADK